MLLKQQLSGRALVLINSLESNNQGYVQAKLLLEQALASPELQKIKTIKMLSELNLEECDDAFEYISKFKTVLENVKTLNLSTDSICQYFIWNGFNDAFKNIMIGITNETYPSLENIENYYFKACERYTHKPKRKRENVSSNYAVKVKTSKNKIIYCPLCENDGKNSNHYLNQCTVYVSPQSKIEKLDKINACSKCGYGNHNTENCKFKFKNKCIDCNGDHWRYLCNKIDKLNVKPNTSTKSKHADKNVKEIVSKSLQINASGSFTIGNVVLPTFQFELNNKTLRGMKDSGC